MEKRTILAWLKIQLEVADVKIDILKSQETSFLATQREWKARLACLAGEKHVLERNIEKYEGLCKSKGTVKS